MDPDDRLMTMKEVEQLIGFSKVHIYQMIREGRFPKQLHLGPNKVAWLRSEVLGWVGERAAAREAA
ncbi:MAG TPA: AlpA family transcriptional regulator [Novosphingobium sp.]|nr:AlpA family transcriptional regulator [Novosphingobium sp.]